MSITGYPQSVFLIGGETIPRGFGKMELPSDRNLAWAKNKTKQFDAISTTKEEIEAKREATPAWFEHARHKAADFKSALVTTWVRCQECGRRDSNPRRIDLSELKTDSMTRLGDFRVGLAENRTRVFGVKVQSTHHCTTTPISCKFSKSLQI